MSVFHFDIKAEGDELLNQAMTLVFSGEKAVGYVISDEYGIIFCNCNSDYHYKPPGWLYQTKYPPQPDHDGHNNKGWRLYNNEYGYVGGIFSAIIAVKPAWIEYGI